MNIILKYDGKIAFFQEVYSFIQEDKEITIHYANKYTTFQIKDMKTVETIVNSNEEKLFDEVINHFKQTKEKPE